jgi:hypothetical protein
MHSFPTVWTKRNVCVCVCVCVFFVIVCVCACPSALLPHSLPVLPTSFTSCAPAALICCLPSHTLQVEQRQYELALLLLVTPFQEELPSGNSGSAGKGSSSDDGDNCALLVFLRTLLLRNRAALRDVPPPGLSDPTVLMSAFFCVLRLLTPALEDAMMRQSGPLAAFPAARLLASTGTSAAEDAPPLDDAPRLGGVLSHLAREHPLQGPELQPLGPPALPAAAVGGTPAAAWPAGLQAAWVPELLCVASLLYSWRVGHSLRMVSSLAASVDASSAALAQLEHMAAAAGDAGAEEVGGGGRDAVAVLKSPTH